ncbi:DUF835 domain-containing protein [Thermococcus sp.]
MELVVSLVWLAADVFLLLIIGYAAYYALRRVSRYSEPLNRLVKITAISLILATLGRALDIVDDFSMNPSLRNAISNAEFVLYFFAIAGTIYGILNYMSNIEKRMFPAPEIPVGKSRLNPGAFLLITESCDLLSLLKGLESPTLLITRNPHEYNDLPDNVSVVWITPSAEKGIPPTKLHVLLEGAVKFLREGGRVVIIDCVETLLIYNEFKSVFRFLTALKDNVVSSGGTLVLVVGKDTMERRELNVLMREFLLVENVESLFKTSS